MKKGIVLLLTFVMVFLSGCTTNTQGNMTQQTDPVVDKYEQRIAELQKLIEDKEKRISDLLDMNNQQSSSPTPTTAPAPEIKDSAENQTNNINDANLIKLKSLLKSDDYNYINIVNQQIFFPYGDVYIVENRNKNIFCFQFENEQNQVSVDKDIKEYLDSGKHSDDVMKDKWDYLWLDPKTLVLIFEPDVDVNNYPDGAEPTFRIKLNDEVISFIIKDKVSLSYMNLNTGKEEILDNMWSGFSVYDQSKDSKWLILTHKYTNELFGRCDYFIATNEGSIVKYMGTDNIGNVPQWDAEDKNIYYKQTQSGGLSLYNLDSGKDTILLDEISAFTYDKKTGRTAITKGAYSESTNNKVDLYLYESIGKEPRVLTQQIRSFSYMGDFTEMSFDIDGNLIYSTIDDVKNAADVDKKYVEGIIIYFKQYRLDWNTLETEMIKEWYTHEIIF